MIFIILTFGKCARCFVAALYKELALITVIEMWGLESRSRTSRSRSRLEIWARSRSRLHHWYKSNSTTALCWVLPPVIVL